MRSLSLSLHVIEGVCLAEIELQKVCFLFRQMKRTEENEIKKQNKDTQWDGDERLPTALHNNNNNNNSVCISDEIGSQPCDRQHG